MSVDAAFNIVAAKRMFIPNDQSSFITGYLDMIDRLLIDVSTDVYIPAGKDEDARIEWMVNGNRNEIAQSRRIIEEIKSNINPLCGEDE